MNELPIFKAAPSQAAPSQPGFALWQIGFRPFYLFAALFSALSVLTWAAQFTGFAAINYLAGPLWHGHEMMFGYALAIISGFLLTAVRNWTGQDTPSGAVLIALATLWLAGRVMVLTSYAMAAAIVNALFPLAIAIAIAIPMARSRNGRNYFFVAIMVSMSALILAFHGAAAQIISWPAHDILRLAIDLVMMIMIIMGGRVIPMFTANGIPGTRAERHPILEKIAIPSVVLLILATALNAPPLLVTTLAGVAAILHLVRLALWRPWRTTGTPLVWVLHIAYLWIVLHLFMRAMVSMDLLASSAATHALTAGAIGSLTLGMMARTARGHTGRMLKADTMETAAFVLINLGALARVSSMMGPAQWMLALTQAAGICWACAFALYVIKFWPILSRARVDGKAG